MSAGWWPLPDAHDGYALDGSGTALYRISDTAGAAARLAAFPDAGVDLALADRWLLVATPESGMVWRVDRLATRPAHPIRTGRFPIALAVA